MFLPRIGHEEVVPLLGGSNNEALARLANGSVGIKPTQTILLLVLIYSESLAKNLKSSMVRFNYSRLKTGLRRIVGLIQNQ